MYSLHSKNNKRYLGIFFVVVNRESDTCFENGLVMGSADYLYYTGLVKTAEKLF